MKQNRPAGAATSLAGADRDRLTKGLRMPITGLARVLPLPLVLSAAALVTSCGDAQVGVMGKPCKASVFFNVGGDKEERADFAIELDVRRVVVANINDAWVLGFEISVKNEGTRALSFSRGNTVIQDARGRRFEGVSQRDAGVSDDFEFKFVESGPGLKSGGIVCFKLPRDAFDGDLWLGFVSSLDKDRFQAKTLVYDRKTSTYTFGSAAQFMTPQWVQKP